MFSRKWGQVIGTPITYLEDHQPLILRISSNMSGGSPATYLGDWKPHIEGISSHISGGSAAKYWALFNLKSNLSLVKTNRKVVCLDLFQVRICLKIYSFYLLVYQDEKNKSSSLLQGQNQSQLSSMGLQAVGRNSTNMQIPVKLFNC